MAKTRKGSRGNSGIVGRVWAVPKHLLNATGNSVGEIGTTAGNLTKRTLLGARHLGNIWTSHADMALKNTLSPGSRRGSKRRGAKRGGAKRRTTRKH